MKENNFCNVLSVRRAMGVSGVDIYSRCEKENRRIQHYHADNNQKYEDSPNPLHHPARFFME